ncbi:hypothetical protein WMY93_003056 [Mugilogobius chulae]|uniref:lysoplasmalogenase n=1 Tax=Mugilogobius chulae TaxID=88201 RepID=A0AAW0PWC9_9GOBI
MLTTADRGETCLVLCSSTLSHSFGHFWYFYHWTPESMGSTISAGIKSAPALLLAVVVLSWNGPASILGVAGGLIFSAVGDFCLVWPEKMFIHGEIILHYALGYGCVCCGPPPLLIDLPLFALQLRLLLNMAPPLLPHHIPDWRSLLCLLVPIPPKGSRLRLTGPRSGLYVLVITLMGSLAIRTRRLTSVLGSLVFIVSDMTLAVQVFKVAVIEHGTVAVMVTYYLSQLLIAVGDVKATESKDDFSKWKRA